MAHIRPSVVLILTQADTHRDRHTLHPASSHLNITRVACILTFTWSRAQHIEHIVVSCSLFLCFLFRLLLRDHYPCEPGPPGGAAINGCCGPGLMFFFLLPAPVVAVEGFRLRRFEAGRWDSAIVDDAVTCVWNEHDGCVKIRASRPRNSRCQQ